VTIDNDKFEIWAEMIRSDQMTHEEVHEFLKDNSDFASWYLSEKVRDAVTIGNQ
jgi:phosphotransacetylase